MEERIRKKWENGIPKGYIGVNELCEWFGKSKKTIYQMVAEGRLPKPFKDGKLNIWDRKEIKSILEYAKFTKQTTRQRRQKNDHQTEKDTPLEA